MKTAARDVPLRPITIAECGELLHEEKLTEETADFLWNYEYNKEEKK